MPSPTAIDRSLTHTRSSNIENEIHCAGGGLRSMKQFRCVIIFENGRSWLEVMAHNAKAAALAAALSVAPSDYKSVEVWDESGLLLSRPAPQDESPHSRPKPAWNSSGTRYSQNPSKNYLFHILANDIRILGPSRSLDAGVGELRSFWMFPGQYVGITHSKKDFMRGRQRPPTKELIASGRTPEVYLMRLESDFSFLGTFDVCVCTNTLPYIQDHVGLVKRLSARVRGGGSLIVENSVRYLPGYIEAIGAEYEDVDVVYWGYKDCDVLLENVSAWGNEPPTEQFLELTLKELNAPNMAEGHAYFYLHARRKKTLPVAKAPAPEIVNDDGLFVVVKDIPFVKMDT